MITKPKQATATTQEKGGMYNVLMRNPSRFPGATILAPQRKIICRAGISKSDCDAVVKLYDALVHGDKRRTVNVTMIVDEAFPIFEQTIGEANFLKIKKYYGIGGKPSKSGRIQEKEIKSLLDQLRTIENAQYYIDGYKELLELTAATLTGAHEEMTVLERAKFMRMYHTIFVGYSYFAQDFKRTVDYQRKVYCLEVDFSKVFKNNPMSYHPEEFFETSKILIEPFRDNTLFYDLVCLEFNTLDKKLQKEVLHFAELKVDDCGFFKSINTSPKFQTFGAIRNIKNKVHPELGVYPMEMFMYEDRMKAFYFDDLYQLYKILTVVPLESFKVHTERESFIEGSREVLKERTYYTVSEEFDLSGQKEIDRILRMVDYLAAINFTMKTSEGKDCDMGIYMAAFNFMHTMKYIDVTINPKKEFDLAETLMERDSSGALKEYQLRLIDETTLRERLNINAAFEKEYFGIETLAAPLEIAKNFAVDNKYVNNDSEISCILLENVVLPGNEEYFTKFAQGEISEETLKARIGFAEEFAKMYFNLSAVDMTAIENQLQELKRVMAKKNELKRYALLINLYCYIIEEQVPCGPKNKVPKRNKGLKPANLKAQIA